MTGREFLAGGGETGALMRSLDWSTSPLGLPEAWPPALRTAVSICLNSRFPTCMWWGDELTLLYNDPYGAILAHKHPRAMGQAGQLVWSEIWDVIGPMLAGVIGRGEATWSEDLLLQVDRNGYPEEAYFTFSYSPIRDEAGVVRGIYTPVTETTERVIADRRLRTVTALAARTADAQSVADVCEQAVAVLATNPQDVPFARLDLGDRCVAQTGSEPAETVTLPVRRDGSLVAGVSPRRALDDPYREFFRLLADQIATSAAGAKGLEEERARAAALAELDRAKTEFFSNVSHEFRTPLTLMLGPLGDSLADTRSPLPEGQRERVETAHRSSLRLLRLVNALLDFSRLEAGRMEPAIEAVDLRELASDAAGGFRSLMESAGLTLDVDLPAAPVHAAADPEMAEKILLNLLSNAYKFTLEGGVRLTVEARDGSAALVVRDTGAGVPADELPRLFERFHRVRGIEARSHEGSGIGLALVQELARLQGGSIAVESRLGEGTAFTVTLPLAPAGAAPVKPRTSEQRAATLAEAARWGAVAASSAGGDARILVVDDNADMRDYLTRLLAPHWTVEGAADGQQALERARRGGLDLVVTDVMMPRLDGFGLLRELRGDPATRRLPVIVLSARAGDEAAVEGLDAGADDYVVKPFSAGELVARVRSHLEVARLREEVETAERERAGRAEAVAETLQRSLLSERLPELPELQLAGRYVPAGRELHVGGDWYDAIPLADGRVVLAIGDVAGHGIRAAAVMGEVSHALRAYAREGYSPAKLLRRLDSLVLAAGIPMVTCQCAQLDPATGELRWASAGHPPPLLVRADGGVEWLQTRVAHPLGVMPGTRQAEATGRLEDGDALVLFTDGLVERRGPAIDDGVAALSAALAPGEPDAMCDAALATLDGDAADDVALLVARRRRLTAPQADLTVAAEPGRLRDVRRWLEAWLRGNGISGARAEDLVLAVHEASMNAVEHAYGAGDGSLEVSVRRDGDAVEAEVGDRGRWRQRPRAGAGDRGRGESLMRSLVDAVQIERGEGGTRVRLRTVP